MVRRMNMSARKCVITNISFFALSPHFYRETQTNPFESSLQIILIVTENHLPYFIGLTLPKTIGGCEYRGNRV